MRIQQYWIDLLYSLTEDDLKVKVTEMNELKRMDTIAFFQQLQTFQIKMDKRIAQANQVTNRRNG